MSTLSKIMLILITTGVNYSQLYSAARPTPKYTSPAENPASQVAHQAQADEQHLREWKLKNLMHGVSISKSISKREIPLCLPTDYGRYPACPAHRIEDAGKVHNYITLYMAYPPAGTSFCGIVTSAYQPKEGRLGTYWGVCEQYPLCSGLGQVDCKELYTYMEALYETQQKKIVAHAEHQAAVQQKNIR